LSVENRDRTAHGGPEGGPETRRKIFPPFAPLSWTMPWRSRRCDEAAWRLDLVFSVLPQATTPRVISTVRCPAPRSWIGFTDLRLFDRAACARWCGPEYFSLICKSVGAQVPLFPETGPRHQRIRRQHGRSIATRSSQSSTAFTAQVGSTSIRVRGLSLDLADTPAPWGRIVCLPRDLVAVAITYQGRVRPGGADGDAGFSRNGRPRSRRGAS
jgi:hypothetical protein